jgi:hypothetical protein
MVFACYWFLHYNVVVVVQQQQQQQQQPCEFGHGLLLAKALPRCRDAPATKMSRNIAQASIVSHCCHAITYAAAVNAANAAAVIDIIPHEHNGNDDDEGE